jgi:hypothetical protein
MTREDGSIMWFQPALPVGSDVPYDRANNNENEIAMFQSALPQESDARSAGVPRT